ncbi:MAG: RdgB/HAM1 family non-canonical purine NTP pyrophosphatase [Gammaproteobacteria bacterium]|nr:RdgB/HAM1 family non-canonical purine NTP pyrophosphatase [Gammaproteobacteria bacterium]
MLTLPTKIVLASNNAGKLREFQYLFNDWQCEVIPQKHFAIADAEETGLSFIENALIKARHAAQLSGLPALADDSGIAVDVLNGAPGIYSARYAGINANDQLNNEKLLVALRDVAPTQRSARYLCAIAFVEHATDPTPIITEGRWEGRILNAPQGHGGFGYDPLFWLEEHQQSAAELSSEIKNKISHRAQALQLLRQRLGRV